MKKELIHDFTQGKITGPLIRLSLPLLLGNILQIVYNLVDMAVVGNVEGQIGLSAVSVGGELTDFFTVFAMGFSNAAQIVISQHIGAGKRKRLGKIIGTFSSILIIMALVFTFFALVIRRNLLFWMNTPPETYDAAFDYLVISMSGLIFVYGYNAISAILRGMGDSKHPFIFIAIAAVLNIVLDLLFVAVFHTGAWGAALATVISQAVSCFSCIVFLAKRKESLGFDIHFSDFRIDREYAGTIIKLGLPMALKSAAVSISRLFTNANIYVYGLTVTTVTGIGNKLNSIGVQVSNAINHAGSTMVGQNIGAEKYSRIPKIVRSVWVISLVILAAFSGAVLLFPKEIFMLFTSDETIIPVAMEYVPVAVVMFIACAARSGSNALVNGSGNFAVNLAVAILDAIVLRIGLGLLFGLAMGYGYQGFWYGNAISGFTPFVIGIIFLASGRWKTRKHIVKD